MSWGDDDRARVEETCRLLTPPTRLSSVSGASASAANDDGWVKGQVSRLLEQLHEQALRCPAEAGVELRSKIFVAAARFIDVRRPRPRHRSSSAPRDAFLPPTAADEEKTQAVARSILLAVLGQQEQQSATVALARHVLAHYIKPLFSATQTDSVRTDTGRAASKPAGLVDNPLHRATSTAEEDIVWKGGGLDLASTAAVRVLGEPMLLQIEGDHRNAALGCCHVLGAACQSLGRGATLTKTTTTTTEEDEEDVDAWPDLWPLVLPPLLTLLEDAGPRFRLVGARILATSLLSPGSVEARLRVASLMGRTGLAPLLFAALETSFAYAASSSDPYAAPLLEASTDAHIRLALLLRPRPGSGSGPGSDNDEHSQRLRLYTVLDDAVLRIWAYSSTSSSSPATPSDKDEDGCEPTDVLRTTLATLLRLSQPDALGPAMAPYLDTLLDFLCAHFGSAERGALAIRAAAGLVDACRVRRCSGDRNGDGHGGGSNDEDEEKQVEMLVAPGVARWSGKILASVCRAWTLSRRDVGEGHNDENNYNSYIQRACRQLVQALRDLDGMQAQMDRLVALDAPLFSPLFA
ncbi:hypothetical protein FA10DRAFT_281439 [Acaromyces ingoldii]|uniref:Uncharacterized protein n=1 Tax=Acaromyces ingoldii TaxID=215250 RepID=A0A316YFR6_9BASI|nr:hypothetical protein FA10DRAFT_281439 [Acaromyces ingoldii]PWN87916.1 hypothetical protein FA10DRAFT_281439 [Acaromyces ingoldii]